MRSRTGILPVQAALLILCCLNASASDSTFWTTGKALMPAWGLYPNGETYDGTKSLDQYSAWKAGRLTWVAEFPADGQYTVFVRRIAAYGHVTVSLNDVPIKGGKGWTRVDNQSNNRYRWENVGRVHVTKGSQHVDLEIEGMFDAVVFTTNTAFNPDNDSLPEPLKQPVLRASRKVS